jgi:hypothetical protein
MSPPSLRAALMMDMLELGAMTSNDPFTGYDLPFEPKQPGASAKAAEPTAVAKAGGVAPRRKSVARASR